MKKNHITFPTILTLSRLILSPLVLPLLLYYLLPLNIFWINGALALLFVFFALTDFFDGFLARKYKQESDLGRVLDPIADKCLLYATLVSLLAAGKIYFYWVIILVGRELFIMGLRQVALEYKIEVPVSWLGKLKTVVHMVFITVLIANPYQQLGLQDSCGWNSAELVLLIGSLLLSMISAYLYYSNFMNAFNAQKKDIHD